MIRFKAKFQVYGSLHVGIPKTKHYNENFWCSFNTKRQLIMCNVIYLGEDETMLSHKWYNGIIELPYGEKFSPFSERLNQDFSELINMNEPYNLNVGGEIVGDCELLEVMEIIKDDFAVKHHKDGTI